MKRSIFLLIFLFLLTACQQSADQNQTDTTNLTSVQVSTEISNHRIQAIVQDHHGYIWIATYRGLNRFDGNLMHQYFCDDRPNGLPDNQVRNLYCDRQGRLWVVTKSGVARYLDSDDFEYIPIPDRSQLSQGIVENSRGEIFLLQPHTILRYDSLENAFSPFISNIPFASYSDNQLLVDDEDNLWSITQRGAFCYNARTQKQVLALDDPSLTLTYATIIDHQLWLGVENGGIKIFDIGSRQWINPYPVLSNDTKLVSSRIHNIYRAEPDLILLGTSDGLFAYRTSRHRLMHQSQTGFPIVAPDFIVSHMLIDRGANLWMGSSDKGFVVRSKTERTFNADSYLLNVFDNVPVSSLAVQDNQLLWIATSRNGLWSYELSSHKMKHYTPEYLSKFFSDPTSEIYYCFTDSQEQLWLCCIPKGVFCLKPEGDELRLISKDDIEFPLVMAETSDHTICVGTYTNNYYTKRATDHYFEEHRLLTNNYSFMANLLQLRDGRTAALVKGQALRMFEPGHTELGPQMISDADLEANVHRSLFLPTSVCQDKQGDLWIGTVSNGVLHYELSSGKLEAIPNAPCEDIAGIEQDDQGYLWVSTQYGLGRLDPKSRTFINYYKSDGLNGNEFYDRCSCHLPNGLLVFGGSHGLTVFDPQQIEEKTAPMLQLEDLRIHNQLVRPTENGPIQTSLRMAPAVNLSYDQNNFSISYSSLDFGEGLRFSYQYQLEGYNTGWVDADQQFEAFFSKIPAGEYQFKVRVMSRDQQRIMAEQSIPVIINPAPWLTWWAKLLYAIAGLLIIYQIVSTYRRIRKEKWNRLQTEREREHEKRINTMNMSFFANVSHEFRIPLTIISAPINQLINDSTLSTDTRSILTVVQRSVDRMLRLVNQMMDFHKLEDDHLELEVQQLDIVKLLKGVVEPFQYQAKEKKISLTAKGLEEPFIQWTDVDKVEKIVYNLLGNAVKYTPTGGHIELDFDVLTREEAIVELPKAEQIRGSRFVMIRVSDDGLGIPDKQLPRVFERYYQLSRQHQGEFNWGTGIGLYYCKRLVDLHMGIVTAANRSGESTGAIFTVLLPVDDECYASVKQIQATQSQTSRYPLANVATTIDETTDAETSNDERPSILVVDDDTEIVRYLKMLLRHDYHVRGCYDVDSALAIITEFEPELIISDVMMPVKDGYELCREVKNSLQLCHIPVVLVTAKTTTSDQIEGLDCGADAYVSKPFDPTYLLTLVANILKNREKVRHLLTENTQTVTIEENVLSPQDKAFMTEFYAIMEKELSNPDLDINHITEIMHVSRTKFYYKVKGLTGEKPGNFFRLYKLNRAAELIREGKNNISEIADITGFSSPSYFSTCFKKQFGVAPSEYF